MGFLDTLLSFLPSVPFLPPSTPTKDSEAGKPQKGNGALYRFIGTTTEVNTANNKDTRDEIEADR